MRLQSLLKIIFTGCILSFLSFNVHAQSQEDYNTKLGEIYTHAADKKKALTLAKELYDLVEKTKSLQNYSNYYLLKNIFEVQAPDAALAKTCMEKATKAMNALVGTTDPVTADTTNPTNQWFYVLYPALFSTADPQNASKALAFIKKHPTLENFNAYTFIAYAFERNGDFNQAKENYEKALALAGNEKEEYHPYVYYTSFLARTGEYLKAEELIRKMEKLALEANDIFKTSYQSEAISTKVVYYLSIGDFQSYIQATQQQYDLITKMNTYKYTCDPYVGIRLNQAAFAKEMLKDYDGAERGWKSRDSANYIWVNCHNKEYPNNQYFPVSMYPVYLIKRGKQSKLPKPASFYIKETEAHYNSYSQYADISVNFMKATQLAFLGSARYPELFQPLIRQLKNTRNFRESTMPLTSYAYFSMRDRKMTVANDVYRDLFILNADWINDVIFTFGEKAFATYYNNKLKEGYDNFHSLVKMAADKMPDLFPAVASQDLNNILFTKSITLKGTQKRKEAFLNSNDSSVVRLYDEWIAKKQQLIRQYLRSGDPSGIDTVTQINQALVTQMQEEVNHLENELTDRSKDFKKYLKIIPPDWKEVRAQLKEGEAAIEMIRFQWRDQVYYSDTSYYAAYIITNKSDYPEVVYFPEQAADLDNKFYKLYKNNIRLKIDDKESYDHFWKPIAEKLSGIKKIYFSPDGIFHLINISTLKNKQSGKFLLDELEVQNTTSGIDINSRAKTRDVHTAVLFGRPSYKTGSTVFTPVADNTTRSFVGNFKDKVIADLPGTEEEVMVIRKELDGNRINVKFYLKEEATEDKIYKLKSPDILHIATHGYWSGAGENATDGYRSFNAMVNSGLLLAGVVNYYSAPVFPDSYDGILTAYEAQNLDLNTTSLVILSACETSLGYLDAGEGVYGLQRAFRAAGAESIMTSLWKVDDNATRDFMIAFYRQYLLTKNKADAFHLAQKAIKEKYKDPFFWGAFIMTGN